MGTDIHILVEEKVDGKWIPMEGSFEIESEDGSYYIGPYGTDFYFGRDYNSFAILADVRNGFGFAGCDTGDGFEIIDRPRGIPVDASEVFKEVCEMWEGDAHSHSYFYLKELKEWEEKAKNLTTKHRGFITLNSFKERLKNNETGAPTGSYCGGVSGKDVVLLDEKTAESFTDKEQDKSYYVQIEWEESYLESAVNLVRYIDMLRKLEVEKDLCHNCIRICFFFDN